MASPRAAKVQAVRKAPRIGLVLGGGGARGLAHILMLEAFDELGIKPAVMAGTSIGAIFGAAYASGLSGRDIREHTRDVLTRRFDLVRGVIGARAKRRGGLWTMFQARSALLQPGVLLDVVMPERVARDFAKLDIPLKIVVSDFYGLEPMVFSSGDLRTAVAASMALPVIFEPVIARGRTLIDGGLTNPLPFDLLFGEADIIVAIDVSGVPRQALDRQSPTAIEALFSASFLFERSIIREKLKHRQPDIYIDAGMGKFQVLDFLRVDEILASAEPAKAMLLKQLARVLAADVVAEAGAPEARGKEKLGRRLLKSLGKPRRKPS